MNFKYLINYYLVRPQVVCQVMAHLYEAKPADFFAEFQLEFSKNSTVICFTDKIPIKKITKIRCRRRKLEGPDSILVNFSDLNFVRGADGSEILKNFRKNSKVISFLWSEYCQNF